MLLLCRDLGILGRFGTFAHMNGAAKEGTESTVESSHGSIEVVSAHLFSFAAHTSPPAPCLFRNTIVSVPVLGGNTWTHTVTYSPFKPFLIMSFFMMH